jgi:tRNA threonylcarbamoyl adenosine modification protein YjeE
MSDLCRELDERGVERLAELLALKLRKGDVVALSGDLGTGKTTLARALIRAMPGAAATEVTSPSFPLINVYETARLTITHCDLYRLTGAEEARELPLEEAIDGGALLIEWPERAGALPEVSRYDITLAATTDPGTRRLSLRGIGNARVHAARIGELLDFLTQAPSWRAAHLTYLEGDASKRSYARLTGGPQQVLLMDAPRQEDGPPVRDGMPYSRIARLADAQMARAFVAIAAVLREAHLSAPETLAWDLDRGLLLVEDLGDRVFGREITAGRRSQAELLFPAVDVLVHLRGVGIPARLPLPDGTSYVLPRRDAAAFEIEIELLLDWYWPAVKGAPAPAHVRAEFAALWRPVLDRLLALPGGWFLRDFHSPNLIWLADRAGMKRVGVIDFQDALNEHFAFDLLSLLQDARIDVAPALQDELFAYYCDRVAAREPHFDKQAFTRAYVDFGAQRNTRLLGLWARLRARDGKSEYLRHIPRSWGYLERNLRDPVLAHLAAWYDAHFPPGERGSPHPEWKRAGWKRAG